MSAAPRSIPHQCHFVATKCPLANQTGWWFNLSHNLSQFFGLYNKLLPLKIGILMDSQGQSVGWWQDTFSKAPISSIGSIPLLLLKSLFLQRKPHFALTSGFFKLCSSCKFQFLIWQCNIHVHCPARWTPLL